MIFHARYIFDFIVIQHHTIFSDQGDAKVCLSGCRLKTDICISLLFQKCRNEFCLFPHPFLFLIMNRLIIRKYKNKRYNQYRCKCNPEIVSIDPLFHRLILYFITDSAYCLYKISACPKFLSQVLRILSRESTSPRFFIR